MTRNIQERIEELVDAFMAKLDRSGLPAAASDELRDPLRSRLADERFRQFIASRMNEPPSRTLEGLVLSYDPRLDLVDLSYKN